MFWMCFAESKRAQSEGKTKADDYVSNFFLFNSSLFTQRGFVPY